MMAADLADVLRRTHLLGSVPDADLAALVGDPGCGCFRRGQVVCTMGDPGDTLIVVIPDRSRSQSLSRRRQLTLVVVGPGRTLGEVSVADGGPRSADVETLEDSRRSSFCANGPAAARPWPPPGGHPAPAHRGGIRPGVPGPATPRRQVLLSQAAMAAGFPAAPDPGAARPPHRRHRQNVPAALRELERRG